MKRSLIIMLVATLLAGALMVSCNSDITSNSEDKLVKVSIAGNSKGIDVQSVSDSADDYYWYYKAVKTDNSVYRTGSTEWKAVKDGTGLTGADLGYFSTGDWKFSFWGYSTPVAEAPTAAPATGYAYYKTDLAVSVTDTTYITVELNAAGTGTAKVVIGDMNWVYQPETNTTYQATLDYLNGKTATIHFDYKTGTNEYASLTTNEAIINSSSASATASFTDFASTLTLDATAEGTVYKIKAYVTIGDETVGESSEYTVTAYYGGKVVLTMTGDVAVTDNESGYHVFIAGSYIPEIGAAAASTKTPIVIENNVSEAKSFTTNITAVSQSVETTTEPAQTSVAFEAGSFTLSTDSNTSSEIKMDIVVYQTEAAQAKFTISQNTTAFAGLDLSVDLITTTTTGTETTTETESVEEFRGQAVTVTTYIARGLSGVTVTCPTNNTGITFNTGDSIGDDGTGYDPATGKLVFKTTHFSEFAVGADQNVYDKTSNTAYRLGTSTDGDAKKGLLLDTANNVVAVDSSHEYLLLDNTKANDVADSIDAFNSNIKWSAVHAANDTPSELFDGGYGTKIEPYLIGNRSNLEKIKEKTSTFSYFKVSTEDESIDLDNWVTIDINGCFNGSGIKLTNLDSPLFGSANYQSAKTVKIGNFSIYDCEIRMQTGRGAVCSNPAYNSIFHDISISGYIEGQGQVSAVVSYPGSGVTEFKNINVSADIVSLGDAGAAVFVLNPYKLLTSYGGNSNSKLVFNDCHFTGKMAATGNCKFFYVHTITVPVEYSNIDDNEFGSAVNTYNRYALASQSSKITTSSIDISGIVAGHVFEIPKLVGNATTCTVTVAISPNGPNESGSFTGVYLRDKNIQLSNQDSFVTTNCVKLTSASVNDTTKNSGLCDLDSNGLNEHYNIVSSAYGTTHNGGHLSVIQYDSDGKVVGFASTSLFPATQN